MKISKREMTLGVLTLTAVLIGSTWYIVDNKTSQWKNKAKEITHLKQQLVYYKNAITMQDNWLDELDELESQLPIFDAEKRSVAPILMETVKQIAARHQVLIPKSNPRTEKPTEDLFELGISCSWEGTLEAITHFLSDLQKQGVRYNIQSLTIKPVGKNSGKLTGNMLINCAYTRQPKLDS